MKKARITRNSMRPLLLLMVKEPRFGRVKTRLAREIGVVDASWWFRHQTSRLIRDLQRDPRWELALSVSPDQAGMASRFWPNHLARYPQGSGDLGRRMMRALQNAGPRPVLLVGGDIPQINTQIIAQMFAGLRGAASALGPAYDGGFWGIGLRHGNSCPNANFLDGIKWSADTTGAQTRKRLVGFGPVFTGPRLQDVDTAKDLSFVNR